MSVNIFEKATRDKLRFATSRGELSVEELWDLKLADLDIIAKSVNKKLKDEGEESFIGKKSKSCDELTLKLDVLKSIITTKMEDADKARTRAEKKSQVDFMQNLLQKKKLDQMEGMSMEEIEKQLSQLLEEVAA